MLTSLVSLFTQKKVKKSIAMTGEITLRGKVLPVGEIKEKIVEVAAGIRNRKFDAKTGTHCDWCDYKILVCPAWEVG